MKNFLIIATYTDAEEFTREKMYKFSAIDRGNKNLNDAFRLMESKKIPDGWKFESLQLIELEMIESL